MNRDETKFDLSTPRELLGQFDIYKKLNGLEEDQKAKVEEKYIDNIQF